MNTTPQPLTKKAGFVHRAVAVWLGDYTLPYLPVTISWAFSVILNADWNFLEVAETTRALWVLAPLALIGFINIYLEIFKGASIGKLIFKLRICNKDGTKSTVPQRAIRALAKHAPLALKALMLTALLITPAPSDPAPLIISLLELIRLIFVFGFLMALGKSKRALHDRIAGTAVFSTKNIEIKRSGYAIGGH